MKHEKILLFATALTLLALAGQLAADEKSFPEILDAGIPGTPKLGQPILVTGATKPILTEKHGLAAPALWDWNGDGKRDLLVGEFETNSEDFPMGADGSTIRVYLNVGTDDDPKFTDEFAWARDTEGTIMEVPQWCCIGFTPQFVDLDDDGHLDMITGQYHPGEVTWFRGTGDGFLPGVKLPQEGDPTADGNPMFGYDGTPGDIGTFDYWVYSSASFGDLEIMRILVAAGGDPLLTTNDNTTALMVAAGADYVEGQDKYGRRSYPAYYETIQRRALEATKLCLELGLDINAVNDSGQTALHGAVYMGGTLIAPYLVEQGAEMDVINLRGQTPWMIAAHGEYRAGSFYRHEETAEVLEALGADKTIGLDLGHDFRKQLGRDDASSRR